MDCQGIGVQFLAGARDFSLLHSNQIVSGAHQASYAMGTRASSSGIKWLRHEADHSPPVSAKVKKAWSYISTSPYVFMASCIIMHRDNFTFI
jgi:hypothetical protein